jgi:nitrite reductase (NADH) large subunit
METADPSILAVGECVEHEHIVYGLVAPLYDMAKVAAKTLAGERAAFRPAQSAAQLKVTGVSLYSAGDFTAADDRESIVLRDDAARTYRRLVIKDDKLIGAVLYGETADGPWFFDRLRDGVPVGDNRDLLAFGQGFDGIPPLAAYGGRCSLGVDA